MFGAWVLCCVFNAVKVGGELTPASPTTSSESSHKTISSSKQESVIVTQALFTEDNQKLLNLVDEESVASIHSFPFEQNTNAVLINITDPYPDAVMLIFRAPAGRAGVVQFNFDGPQFNFTIPDCSLTGTYFPGTGTPALAIRIIKKYPWVGIKCNGETLLQYNLLSKKNPECRGMWAVRSNMTKVELQGAGTVQVVQQDKEESRIEDKVYERLYEEFFNGQTLTPNIVEFRTFFVHEDAFPPRSRTCRIEENFGFLRIYCLNPDKTEDYKCPNSDHHYKVLYNWDTNTMYFNTSCPLDTGFYQACGHGEITSGTPRQITGDNIMCGLYVCELNSGEAIRSDDPAMAPLVCNGEKDCKNTELDEEGCDFNCKTGGHVEQFVRARNVCDMICDCKNCADEAQCGGVTEGGVTEGGVTEGVITKGVFCDGKYMDPSKICDDTQDCTGGDDEMGCIRARCNVTLYHNGFTDFRYVPNLEAPITKLVILQEEDNCDGVGRCDDMSDEVCITNTCPRFIHGRVRNVTLDSRNLCSVPKDGKLDQICNDAHDQLNCSQSSDVALYCPVAGHVTSVSYHVICKDQHVCDDGLDMECVKLSENCKVHKHALCDGVAQCEGGQDERKEMCHMTNRRCVRRYIARDNKSRVSTAGSATEVTSKPQILKHWLMDGVVDCVDGLDEDPTQWVRCGDERIPWATTYREKEGLCGEFYLCSNQSKQMVPFSFLCDKVNSCGKENIVCDAARTATSLKTEITRIDIVRTSPFCLPGLESHQILYHNCTSKPLQRPDKPFGVTSLSEILSPEGAQDCRFLFGEMYVIASCLGLCKEGFISCALGRLPSDSCAEDDGKSQRVFTHTTKGDIYLTFLERSKESEFDYRTPEVFSCPDKKCIPFSKVCDLSDDCGDGADEANCHNHFRCNNSLQIIALSNVCDGKFDCADASDECNSWCGQNLKIIEGGYLVVIAWTIGITATVLNIISVIVTAKQLYSENSIIKVLNQAMICLIALGDLCVGIYLITISYFDAKFRDEPLRFCRDRYDEWLSEFQCAGLGVLSTFGAQLSLYAMTVLSTFRVYSVTSTSLRGSPSLKMKGMLASLAVGLIMISLMISIIPLLTTAEDFFVNGLVYPGNPMLKGALDKSRHVKVLEAHYGYFKNTQELSWSLIRRLIQDMFTTFNGPLRNKRLHFYGNSGVCLFKFFVTPSDPQRVYVWFMIAQNALCFFIITFSYLTISFIVQRSNKRSLKDKSTGKSAKNAAMNRKITLMIGTDFLTWVPFIVICSLHYSRLMDATSWYSLFSIVFLPLNSAINPILYDTAGLWELASKMCMRGRKEAVSSSPETNLKSSKRTLERVSTFETTMT